MSAIDDLVAAYNAAEAEQESRLQQIYDLLAVRSGYRRIVFGYSGHGASFAWSSWDLLPHVVTDSLVVPMTKYILETNQGEA